MDPGSPGEQRADGHLPQETQGAEGGQVDRCELPLDGAPQQEAQGEAPGPGRGSWRSNSSANICSGVHGGLSNVSRLSQN